MDAKQQACAHSSLSLACYFPPFIKALYAKESMSAKSTIGAKISLTIIAFSLTIVHFGYTADILASFSGYWFSVLILPMTLYALIFILALKINTNKFSTQQKTELFAFPLFINLVLFGTLYFLVHYGITH